MDMGTPRELFEHIADTMAEYDENRARLAERVDRFLRSNDIVPEDRFLRLYDQA